MNRLTARLLVTLGSQPKREYVLTQAQTIIGRTSTSDIEINDPEVSRQHALILRQGNQFLIEDLGSTNGTMVNGQRIFVMTVLSDNDQIELGEGILLDFYISMGDSYRPVAETTYSPPYHEQEFDTPARPMKQYWEEGSEVKLSPVSNRRRWLIGCGCGFLLSVFLCVAILFFLDAYDQGRLLYCGPLYSFFNTVLGPFGFSPACALP